MVKFIIFYYMNDFNQLYKNIIKEYQKYSKCARMQVVALLVKNGRILSTGYNGTPEKACNCNELFNSKVINNVRHYYLKKKVTNKNWKEVDELEWKTEHHNFAVINEIHAEQNLIAQCLKNNININDCEVILSCEPCEACARLLYTCGIKKIMYINNYDRGSNGISFLLKNGVDIKQI